MPVNLDQLIFEAMAYHRNLGSTLKSIRTQVRFPKSQKVGVKSYRMALAQLAQSGQIKQVGESWFLTPAGLKKARGWSIRPGWLPEDAWILLAMLLSCGEEGCHLEQIIGAADYIDHGIPTLEQMHGALNRLASGKLIKKRQGRFWLTERTLELEAKVKVACKRSVHSQRHGLAALMDCPCCGVELKAVRWSIELTQADMDKAHKSYMRRTKPK